MNQAVKKRIQELFLDIPWLNEPIVLAEYHDPDDLNPFEVFQQIPPKSRYNFLLDNVHYIIMTFIRGPVCKGQIALNVVRDHFWLLSNCRLHKSGSISRSDWLGYGFHQYSSSLLSWLRWIGHPR